MMNEIELLAPAGSFDSLQAAVSAGADAVYVGGAHFGARAYADNFDDESLKRAIEFTHIHRKKIYLTLNTLLKEDEISSQLGEFLTSPYREGLDAVIVQDLGVLSFVHENFPKLRIHASTQMGITTAYGVEALVRAGVQRIILPRELCLEEIRDISLRTQAELEIFVHGAMCYSYSGQCMMSGMIGGRSGNRGRCAGPCRLPWDLREKRDGMNHLESAHFPQKNKNSIAQMERKMNKNFDNGRKQRDRSEEGFRNRPQERYLLNMKDLCTVRDMPQYLDAGVASLKIEGRMKSPEYVAGTVEIYRKYLDRYLEFGFRKEKSLFEENGRRSNSREEKSLCGKAGCENQYQEEKKTVSEKYRTDEGPWEVDTADLQRLSDLYSRGSFTDGYLHRQNGRSMLALNGPAERIRETEEIQELRKKYLETEKKEKIYGIVKILKHKESVFQLKYAGVEASVYGPVPEEAQSRPLTRETVKEKFSRLGNTSYTLEQLEICMDENVFLDIKTMNGMRRACVEELTEKLLAGSRRKPDQQDWNRGSTGTRSSEKKEEQSFHEPPVYTALISSMDQWKPVLASPKISDIYVEEFLLETEQIPELAREAAEHGKRLFLALPHIFRKRAYAAWEENEGRKLDILRQTDGIGYLVRNLDECEYLLQWAPKPMIFDYTCWRMNHRAQLMWEKLGESCAVRTCVSPELNEKELLHSSVAGCEFVIYGKIPVMIAANCLRKTTSGCPGGGIGRSALSTGDCSPISLVDRKNVNFDVKTVCRYCYNLIYNSVPMALNVEEDRLMRFEFGAFRYQFTTETSRETADILKGKPVKERTRGHFYRGVE